jgi:hypothetical protein
MNYSRPLYLGQEFDFAGLLLSLFAIADEEMKSRGMGIDKVPTGLCNVCTVDGRCAYTAVSQFDTLHTPPDFSCWSFPGRATGCGMTQGMTSTE